MPRFVCTARDLFLALLIFASAAGQCGLVLCHGSDGHVALEPAAHGHCHEAPATLHGRQHRADDNAGYRTRDCTDVPLTAHLEPQARKQKTDRHGGAGFPPHYARSAPGPSTAPHLAPPAMRLRPHRSPPSLVFLRTVVLLT